MKETRVLIVDDHPIITSAYENAISRFVELNTQYKFEVTTLHSLDEAVKLLKDDEFIKNLELVFLDIRIPESSDGKFKSGDDLGRALKEKKPQIKIIISTTFNDNYRLHNIMHNLDPEGLIVKNDLVPKNLLDALQTVLEGSHYYSKTVIALLRKQVLSDFHLDETDRQLLFELSIGTKLRDLPKILPLSTGGVEKRRRRLKEIFKVEGKEDRELILVAKEKGFL
ncbi:response regulator [Salegentibacter sp. HM20]